jgi:excisionase family DNA binding protein
MEGKGEKLLKLKEACKMLGIHPNTLRRWEKIGKIRVIRTKGGARRIPESEIMRLLKEKAPKPTPTLERPAPVHPAPAPPSSEPGITSPFSGGLILLGAALFLTCRLFLISFDSLSFLFNYAVFIALTGASIYLMKRGMMRGDKMAKEGGRILTLLILFFSAFCGITGIFLCLNFSGWFSALRFVLFISWLLLLGVLVEWKHIC